MNEEETTIFYSWQSDLDRATNSSAIRKGIRDAFSAMEINNPECKFNLDEATRDKPGSPNIPTSILDKIRKADIFICDVTTINIEVENIKRKTPNPNVLIELGYAIGMLGWERIIMLMNKEYGKPEDLPFDIDRQRVSAYSVKSKVDNQGKKGLVKLLETAIDLIVLENPMKPKVLIKTDIDIKRERDILNLMKLFRGIHIETFERFIEKLPLVVIAGIFPMAAYFSNLYGSNSFHLYDDKLSEILSNLNSQWVTSLSFDEHYRMDNHGNSRFVIPMDIFPSDKAEEDFNEIRNIRNELAEVFEKLISYVRNEYLEVEIDKLSLLAHEKIKLEMENN